LKPAKISEDAHKKMMQEIEKSKRLKKAPTTIGKIVDEMCDERYGTKK